MSPAIGDQPGNGFSLWGGGKGPTGTKNSPGLSPNVAPPPGFIATPINQSLYLIIATTNKPQQAPPINVPAGASVTIRAHNGQNAGNTNIVNIGRQPEECTTGLGGDPITPDSVISWVCDNLGQIWVMGTAGDGIRISIQAGRQPGRGA